MWIYVNKTTDVIYGLYGGNNPEPPPTADAIETDQPVELMRLWDRDAGQMRPESEGPYLGVKEQQRVAVIKEDADRQVAAIVSDERQKQLMAAGLFEIMQLLINKGVISPADLSDTANEAISVWSQVNAIRVAEAEAIG